MEITYPREEVLMGRSETKADVYYANLETVVSKSLDEYKELQRVATRLQGVR